MSPNLGTLTPGAHALDQAIAEYRRRRVLRSVLPDGSSDLGIHPDVPCGPPEWLLWSELSSGAGE